jgi:hypothetical protein
MMNVKNKMKNMKNKKNDWDPNDMIGCDGSDDGELYDYEKIVHMTDKSVLLEMDGEDVWIPKSQIIDATDKVVTITKWLAQKNGW